ncbi:TPA: hypothetical protein I7682_17990 [Vibrio vulnificus]|nr:hypothetical protein [Vibrio vulnificus]
MTTIVNGGMTLVVAFFVLLWLRLVGQVWKKYRANQAKLDDLGKMIGRPMMIFIVLMGILAWFGY